MILQCLSNDAVVINNTTGLYAIIIDLKVMATVVKLSMPEGTLISLLKSGNGIE